MDIKELLYKADIALKPLGYRKNGNRFWKIDNDIYKLIDFQKGIYGGYFFVNVCIHIVGLPELLTNKLSIVSKPKNNECILRQRIDEVSQNEKIKLFKEGFVFADNSEVLTSVIDAIPMEAEQWFKEWGTYERLAGSEFDEVSNMMTVVPILKKKAFFMLKFYSSLKIEKNMEAKYYLEQYLSTEVTGLKFSYVDNYLKSLINEI